MTAGRKTRRPRAEPLILALPKGRILAEVSSDLEQATGKEPSDLAKHKKTLPVIYAFERAGSVDRARLTELYRVADPSEAEVAEAVTILERVGARDYTREEARRFRDEALAELDQAGVVDPAARRKLEEIIVSVISA